MPIADYTTASVDWMRHGACVPAEVRKLPWLKDEQDVSPSEEQRMQTLCMSCPVLAECRRFADTEHVTGGFWSGLHREHRRTSGRGRRVA